MYCFIVFLFLAFVFTASPAIATSCSSLLASLQEIEKKYLLLLNHARKEDPRPWTTQRAYDLADRFVEENPLLMDQHLNLAQDALLKSGHTTKRAKFGFFKTHQEEGLQISPDGSSALAKYASGLGKDGKLIYSPHIALKTGFGATVERSNGITVYADPDSVRLSRPSPSLFHESVHIEIGQVPTKNGKTSFLGVIQSLDGSPISRWCPQYSHVQPMDEMMAYTESVRRSYDEYLKSLTSGDTERAQYWLLKVKSHAASGSQVTRQTYEALSSILNPGSSDQIQLKPGLIAYEGGAPQVAVRISLNSKLQINLVMTDPKALKSFEGARQGDPDAAGQLQRIIIESVKERVEISEKMNRAYGHVLEALSEGKLSTEIAEYPYEVGLPYSGLPRRKIQGESP